MILIITKVEKEEAIRWSKKVERRKIKEHTCYLK